MDELAAHPKLAGRLSQSGKTGWPRKHVPLSPSKFKIKPGYIERNSPQYFEDVPDGTIYQPDVYELGGLLAGLAGCHYMVDMGCGFGEKLVTACRRHGLMPIGMDHGKNLSHCREAYPDGQWIEVNFENPEPGLLNEEVLKKSVIVCSDLIEHLKDPGPFVLVLRYWIQYAHLAIVSTPERDVRWGTASHSDRRRTRITSESGMQKSCILISRKAV